MYILNIEMLRYIYSFSYNPHESFHHRAFLRLFPCVPCVLLYFHLLKFSFHNVSLFALPLFRS